MGPRRITQDEIREAFAQGWRVDSIEAAELDVAVRLRAGTFLARHHHAHVT